MPALFAVLPVSVRPILGDVAVDNEIEPIAVGNICRAWFSAFNVKGPEPSSPLSSSEIRPPNPRPKTTVSESD